MGVIKWFSSSSYDNQPSTSQDNTKNQPNPNPKRFSIKREYRYGDFMILKINYHDCTNYEGDKILVFKGCNMIDLARQGSIDPHFAENKNYHSPIARFKPDHEGWIMAKFFVENFK